MKRGLLVLAAAVCLVLAPAAAFAEPIALAVDPDHSTVSFSVRHFVTEVHGRFNDFSGSILYDPDQVENSRVEFIVQVASVDTGNEKRDNHLRSEDFFDVQRYPTMSFKSTRVRRKGPDTLEVTGDFTLHGVTRPLTTEVQVSGPIETFKGTTMGFQTGFTVNRGEYGVKFNQILDTGFKVLGEEVKVKIAVEAHPPEEGSRPASLRYPAAR